MATERWVVRERRGGLFGGLYRISRGTEPKHCKRGDWLKGDKIVWWSSHDFESFFPECCHLPPGGGPIEIRIIKVKAVTPCP